MAGWLAGRDAPRVVLTSRSGPESLGAAVLAADLATAGTAAEVIACDVAGRAEMAGLLARIAATGPRLAGVMHAAGVLDDGLLDRTDAEAGHRGGGQGGRRRAPGRAEPGRGPGAVRAVLLGGGHVRRRRAGQLRRANAFLDGLAQRRAMLGLAALSVAWGPWAGGIARPATRPGTLRRRPLVEMDPPWGSGPGQAPAGRDALLAVMDVDRGQFGATAAPFLRDLPEVVRTVREAGVRRPGPGTPGADQAAGGPAPGPAGPGAGRSGPGRGRRGARARLGRGDRGGPGLRRPGVRLTIRWRCASTWPR